MTPVPFSDEEYRLFSEWLSGEVGIWFGPEKREILRSRLDPRRAELGLGTFQELYFHLRFHPKRDQERDRLIPLLTNNESYFFRERPQLDLLRNEVIPALRHRLRAEGGNELRMLSAGCSFGQEAYTLAIMALEAGLPRSDLSVRVTGLDVDPAAVKRARTGCFTEHSFRGVEDDVRERYFRRTANGEWKVVPRVRSLVEVQTANLVDLTWAERLPKQHVVFCRNVLIYFKPDAIRLAAQGLHQALLPGGYLFLGHAETLRRIPTPLVSERRVGAVFYRRPAET